jgi:subtilisin family serine protease
MNRSDKKEEKMKFRYGLRLLCFAIIIFALIGTASAKTWYVYNGLIDFPEANFTNTLQGESSNNTTVNRNGNSMVATTYNNNTMSVFPIDTTINSEEPEFVPGELVVKFKPNVSVKLSISTKGTATISYCSIDSLNEQHGVISLEKVFKTAKKPVAKEIPDLTNIYILKLPKDANILSIAEVYQKNPNVEYAEPNYIAHICIIPNDSYYSQQWAHQNMQSEQAWDRETGDPSVVVAIVDTGVDWDHPDLEANIWINKDEIPDNEIDDDNNRYIDDDKGWDFVTVDPSEVFPGEDPGPEDNDPMDFHGHGTHCSGIAGAVTDNAQGIAGVTWGCKVMALRAGYKGNDGRGYLQISDLSNAIVYAADNGAKVISMSFGSHDISQTEKNAIDYAYSLGVVLVGAAGNNRGDNKIYPAGFDNVIAIAATDHNDEEASFSNFGSWVDVAAPGLDIYSTYFDDNYSSMSGTSMSTPHAAGLIGLILSNNSFTNEEIKTILHTAVDTPKSDFYIGTGRINAYKAIQIDSVGIATLNSSLDDLFLGKTNLEITGTALGISYEVHYGVGIYPTDWVLTGSGTNVDDGILTTWDTSSLTEANFYTIRLTVRDINGQINIDESLVHIDPSLQDGWPKTVDIGFIATPAVADIDGDGDLEIVMGEGKYMFYGEKMYAWHHDGTLVSGWPIHVGYSMTSSPALADIDNDGDLEIFISSLKGKVHAWHHDGTPVNGWPVTTASQLGQSSSTIGDMDNDGDQEIIIGGWHNVYAWHHDGTPVTGWPVTTEGNVNACPAIADIDNDGDLEVFVGSLDKKMYAWHHDGTLVIGWPQSTGHWIISSAALGDIDQDGDIEIVVGSYDHKVYVWHHDGTNVTGWPQDTGNWVSSSPALADIDGDNDLEIIAASLGGWVYAWHHDGTLVGGEWPVKTLSKGGDVTGSPTVGDIDSDGGLEIMVVSTSEQEAKVFAWNRNGTLLDNWPKSVPSDPDTVRYIRQCSPVLNDIDNDGDIEVVVAKEKYLFVWDLEGKYDPFKIEWETFQHDMWHTGLYGFVVADTTPPVITNISATNITTNSATIAWDTDESSDSLVKYGTESGNYTLIAHNSSNVTSHIVYLTGLTANTTYYYVVNSRDQNGNSNQSNEYDFTTKIIISEFFDTGPGTYPSIFGTHNGTITPNRTITVSKLYTYPCIGTGGHTEYARIWNNSGFNTTAIWEGYKGDWYNISFDKSFTFVANETYNYTIRTGSYPQIIHEPTKEVIGGTINCTEFVDANGKIYYDWIPAIRLWM